MVESMAIIQCPNNHYYDDKRNHRCPYCEKMHTVPVSMAGMNEQLTSYITPVLDDDDAQLTEGYGEAVYEYEKTIGVFVDESHNQLTVGWLVCISGAMKGQSYTLHSGRNFVGRSLDMDIALADDASVMENKHFAVVYDPKGIEFYLVCGEGHTYVNCEAVSEQIQLVDNDEIQVGQSRFLFVPFCRKGREWN